MDFSLHFPVFNVAVADLVTIFMTHLVMFYLALDMGFASFVYGSQHFSPMYEDDQKHVDQL